MPKAIRIHRTGGPEVLTWEDVEVGDPGPGEVRIRQTAVGLNFIDTYHRTGLYPLPLPAILGREAAGVVQSVGRGVTGFSEGDRVAYPMSAGGYAEERLIPEDQLVKLPGNVDDRTAAAAMLKGLTTQYLLRSSYRVKAGDTILFHAAAGGVGLLACQWAKHLGATVIGTVGSAAKAELARAHGCDHVVRYDEEDFVARVREITDGRGVPVVYDSVGQSTLDGSLDCLEPCGLLVSFGQSSGPIRDFQPGVLATKGSLYLQRPTLVTYLSRPGALASMSAELFAVLGSGAVRVEIGQTWPLCDAARAHTALESRKTRGATVLLP